MKVTFVPAHMVSFGLTAIVTAGVRFAFTVIVIVLLVPVGVAKQVSLLVISTVTASLFTNVDDENVLPVAVLVPFTFHW